MRRLFLIPLAALAIAVSCGRSEIYREPEDDDVFGLDGGRLRDAGFDAGRDPWFECDVERQDCASDEDMCFYYRLADAGLGSRCVAGECDLVTQDCSNALKCGFAQARDGGRPGRVCIPDGSRTEGARCNGDALVNDCARGLTCAPRGFSDGGSEFVCRKYCVSSAGCTSPQICYALVNVPGIPEIPLTCENPPGGCSLLTQNCGRAGDACYPGQAEPLCFAEGTIVNGGACFFSNECSKGSACLTGRCRVMCAFPSGSPGCSSPSVCREVTGVPGVDGGLGACF